MNILQTLDHFITVLLSVLDSVQVLLGGLGLVLGPEVLDDSFLEKSKRAG